MKFLQISLLIFVFLCILSTSKAGPSFDHKRVKLLDVAYKDMKEVGRYNLLYRSNRPTNGDETEFKYHELIAAMQDAAKANHFFFNSTTPYYLIIYSLLKPNDATNIAEIEYFNLHPGTGEVRSWPVVGTEVNPAIYSSNEIFSMSANLSTVLVDPLDELVDHLYSSLHSFHPSANLLIVFHCTHGKDRTGEVAGAYNMKFNHQNWQQITATNYEVGAINLHLNYQYQRALAWYCYHLQYHQNYQGLQCDNDGVWEQSRSKPLLIGWDEPDDYFIYFILFYFLLIVFLVSILLVGIFFTRKIWFRSLFVSKIRSNFLIGCSAFRNYFFPKQLKKLEVDSNDIIIENDRALIDNSI